MPYLGRAPVGVAGNIIEGDLKVTGQLTAEDTLFKQILDGTDGSSSNAGDNLLIEDGGTDGSGTNAGDDICIEKDVQSVAAGDIISISGVPGGSVTSADEKLQCWAHIDAADGTPVIGDSFNVTSVTDHGVGDHTVTWDTDFASVNYAFCGTGGGTQRNCMASVIATGSVRFYVQLSSIGHMSDADDIGIIASGDQ